jgi:type IV secretory pathway VirB2 component (pilin)
MKSFFKRIALVTLITIAFASISYATDFKGSLRNLQSEVENVLQIVGVIAFLIAGGIFYFSRQRGFEHLTSVVIGTAIFGSASTLFALMMRVFS